MISYHQSQIVEILQSIRRLKQSYCDGLKGIDDLRKKLNLIYTHSDNNIIDGELDDRKITAPANSERLSKADRNRIDHIAKDIAIQSSGNFTYDLFEGQEPKFGSNDFKNLYYVSLEGYEQKFKQRPTFIEIITWVRKHYATLCISGRYIGCWIDKGICYLDISISVFGEDRALAIAGANRQICICHLASKRYVNVNENIAKVI